MAELDGSYNAARNVDRRGGPARLPVSADALAALDAAFGDRWAAAVARVAPRVALAVELGDSWSPAAVARWIAAEWAAAAGSDEPPVAWLRAVPELRGAIRSSRSLAVARVRAATWRGSRGPAPRLDRRRLLELVDQGRRDEEIAEVLGGALGTVRRLRRELGVRRPHGRPESTRTWLPGLTAYREARAAGLSSPDALRRCGAEIGDLRRWRNAERRHLARASR